jgi:hypothetical protein
MMDAMFDAAHIGVMECVDFNHFHFVHQLSSFQIERVGPTVIIRPTTRHYRTFQGVEQMSVNMAFDELDGDAVVMAIHLDRDAQVEGMVEPVHVRGRMV